MCHKKQLSKQHKPRTQKRSFQYQKKLKKWQTIQFKPWSKKRIFLLMRLLKAVLLKKRESLTRALSNPMLMLNRKTLLITAEKITATVLIYSAIIQDLHIFHKLTVVGRTNFIRAQEIRRKQ